LIGKAGKKETEMVGAKWGRDVHMQACLDRFHQTNQKKKKKKKTHKVVTCLRGGGGASVLPISAASQTSPKNRATLLLPLHVVPCRSTTHSFAS
jgi:hypothetical protein